MKCSGSKKFILSIKIDTVSLHKIITFFKENNVEILEIQSRILDSSRQIIQVELTGNLVDSDAEYLLVQLKRHMNIDAELSYIGNLDQFIWFPHNLKDLDKFANRILLGGSEITADHPGFTDELYLKRRKEIATIAAKFKHGDDIPRIQYTDEEVGTWREIYIELDHLHFTHSCREFNKSITLLKEHCGYCPNIIPQLEDISKFLQSQTRFRLRPVQGLLSSRDFLAGLAFRVFHSTQYLRHSSVPAYTPEPDICHELIGHVPMLADPIFAQFCQDIGIASLGASDDDIKKLATCFWFTVEYGLCRENGELKAYGAGLLSSSGELEYCLSGTPVLMPFDLEQMAIQEYPITKFQPVYFVAENFETARDQFRNFAKKMKKPFEVIYDPYTETIRVIDGKEELLLLLKQSKEEIDRVQRALEIISL